MERIDDLQLNGLKIIQNKELFCFGTDAVLLADFAKIAAKERVVDLGTGTGILLFLLYGRQPDANYFGIEIQKELYELAQRSILLNKLADHVEVLQGDIAHAAEYFGMQNDVVVSNPPYEKDGEGLARKAESHRIARKEVLVDLNGVCKAASRLLKTGGRFYMIHKACRLTDIFDEMRRNRMEPKQLRLVQAKRESEPKYVLVCGIKDAKSHLRHCPPLVMQEEDGSESPEVRRIYNRPE